MFVIIIIIIIIIIITDGIIIIIIIIIITICLCPLTCECSGHGQSEGKEVSSLHDWGGRCEVRGVAAQHSASVAVLAVSVRSLRVHPTCGKGGGPLLLYYTILHCTARNCTPRETVSHCSFSAPADALSTVCTEPSRQTDGVHVTRLEEIGDIVQFFCPSSDRVFLVQKLFSGLNVF